MRRLVSLAGVVAMVGLVVTSATGATAGAKVSQTPRQMRSSRLGKEDEQVPYCSSRASYCAEAKDYIGYDGAYTGHDEPAVLFYSHTPGSGNNQHYQFRLPTDPPKAPNQKGTGGTPNFMLHPAFWFGLQLCDTQGSPNWTHICNPDSDTNIFDSPDPNSPRWVGHHPGQAFMELQFYSPGWVREFNGPSCAAKQWCSALNIDTFIDYEGTDVNNDACRSLPLVGDESVNFAYVTKSGVSQAPANPVALSLDANQTGLTPDPSKDLFMNSGDWINLTIQDTPAGLRVVLHDLTSGHSGSMTASVANGFGHVLFQPDSPTCNSELYAYHPMYATSTPHTRNTDAAHTYNVSFSDEIGHFEYCSDVTSDLTCNGGVSDTGGPDDDDFPCFGPSDSTRYQIGGCEGADVDFDGPEYTNTWPGSLGNPQVDQQYNSTPILFTSPTFNGGHQYSTMAFETDLPRIEGATVPPCDRHGDGSGCVNPPVGASFYPFFTTGTYNGTCVWQEGGPFIAGTVNHFGGNSATEFGTDPLHVWYPDGPGQTQYIYEDFRNILPTNPCPWTQDQSKG